MNRKLLCANLFVTLHTRGPVFYKPWRNNLPNFAVGNEEGRRERKTYLFTLESACENTQETLKK